MKTKTIWIWAFIFGLLASGTLYWFLISNKNMEPQVQPPPQQTVDTQNPEDPTGTDGPKQVAVKPFTVSEGKRAMTIAVNEAYGVAGYIESGDYIDIVSIIPPPEDSDEHEAAQILVQNIKVLAIGKKTQNQANSESQQSQQSQQQTPTIEYATVTLEVTPYEGLAIGFAAQRGTLYTMLRKPDDPHMEPVHTHIHLDNLHQGVYKK